MTSSTPENKFSPLSVLRAVKRRWFYLLVPVVVLVPAAWFYAQRLPQRFRASALVGSEPLIPGQPAPGNVVDPLTINAQEELRAIRETLFSAPVLETVAREYGVQAKSVIQVEAGVRRDEVRHSDSTGRAKRFLRRI